MQDYLVHEPGVRHCLIGTCAWTDDTFKRHAKFFPPSAQKTAETMLKHYSSVYGQVEIDTSTYAIPSKYKLQEWVSAVPQGFVFHIKAFGFLCTRHGKANSLPRDLREAFLPATTDQDEDRLVRMADMPAEFVDALWERFNSAVDVLYDAGKLGVVLFQYHASSFGPSVDNLRYLAECRARLRPAFPMAVEFRDRAWFSVGPVMAEYPSSAYPPSQASVVPPPPPWDRPVFESQRQATIYFMRRMGIINVAADDLLHEMPAHEPAQPGMRDGRVLITEDITSPLCAYLRIHRRAGDDRLLSPDELTDWAQRIQRIAATPDGPDAYARACAGIAEGPGLLQMHGGRMRSGPPADRHSETQAQLTAPGSASRARMAGGAGQVRLEDVVDVDGGQQDTSGHADGTGHVRGHGHASASSSAPASGVAHKQSRDEDEDGGYLGDADGDAGAGAGSQRHDGLPASQASHVSAGTARVPGASSVAGTAGGGAGSSSTPSRHGHGRGPPTGSAQLSFSLRPELPPVDPSTGQYIDHPWFFTRLSGPVCINVATYHADQPIVNMTKIKAAVDASGSAGGSSGAAVAAVTAGTAAGATSSAGSAAAASQAATSTRTVARMYDWAGRMAAHYRKHGLEGFFARQAAKPPAGPTSGQGNGQAQAPGHALGQASAKPADQASAAGRKRGHGELEPIDVDDDVQEAGDGNAHGNAHGNGGGSGGVLRGLGHSHSQGSSGLVASQAAAGAPASKPPLPAAAAAASSRPAAKASGPGSSSSNASASPKPASGPSPGKGQRSLTSFFPTAAAGAKK